MKIKNDHQKKLKHTESRNKKTTGHAVVIFCQLYCMPRKHDASLIIISFIQTKIHKLQYTGQQLYKHSLNMHF